MKTTPAPLVILLVCACAASVAAILCPTPARAQAARNDTPTTIGGRRVTTSGTVPMTDTSAGATTSGGGISPRASSAITAGFKYQPPPPPKPEDDEVDLRDIDTPKNEIIRLPNYVVTAKKPPIFTERMLYTQEQLKRLAISRYLSKFDTRFLNRWTIPLLGTSNADRAMQMYLDDERLQNMATAQQRISTQQTAGNTDEASQMKSEYYDMFLRPSNKVNAPPDSVLRQLGQ